MRLFKSKRQKRAEALESFIWYLYEKSTEVEPGETRAAIFLVAGELYNDIDKLMPEWADADD